MHQCAELESLLEAEALGGFQVGSATGSGLGKWSPSMFTLLCHSLTILTSRPTSSKEGLLLTKETKNRQLRMVSNDVRSSEMVTSLQNILETPTLQPQTYLFGLLKGVASERIISAGW